ncbi:MAG: YegS/Rv2252/BmrU family lipid kinase [Eubacteriales bacterium]|nr:YegS/Rv2252/BmrU family lipid kinase [Eubacteriales bacterium]
MTAVRKRSGQKKSELPWKKILFIFNPVAGRSQIRNSLLDILEILSAADFKVVCYPTRNRGDARRIARERRDDYLYIACAGGDGTLDEVVSGMIENPEKPFVPIGYIPAGTTNDFATSLHIPSDMKQAARVIVNGRAFRCDLGLFNGKDYFTYVAAFGLFTGASYQTPQELKNQLGHFAYILQGMTELGQMRAYNMRVRAVSAEASAESSPGTAAAFSVDPGAAAPPVPGTEPSETGTSETETPGSGSTGSGSSEQEILESASTESGSTGSGSSEPVVSGGGVSASGTERGDRHGDGMDLCFEGEYAFGMITNSRSIGGFQNITGSRVDLQDGLFEVTLIRMPTNPLEMSEILMFMGNPELKTNMVISFKTSKILLTCDEQVSWTRDGEYAGSHKRVLLENCPQKLKILVPEEHARPF